MEDQYEETLIRFFGAVAFGLTGSLLVVGAEHVFPRGVPHSDWIAILSFVVMVGSWMGGFALLRQAPESAGLLRAGLLAIYVPLGLVFGPLIPLLVSCYFGDCL